ncbi:glycoside hydrolase family 2 protein [Coniophora puteana RWD-64-598 SS2]|uniref:Beta-mannosidase B n=1 Tax=Coniophora puteana (strain RWD-64-598) TaxID=741705 RepID=A0A5M3MR18_CONPW|nr:glycoside hydrolase family 2 protein [Coniophora puteana RWD-64-598 SS2]EIW81506.1 glycoside hydrolase family 2 protein [Coniophora puteana RWD-64-598 SS2]
MAVVSQSLDTGWSWKQRSEDTNEPMLDELTSSEWTTAHAFPSEVHVELLKAGKIPDPYVGFNEHREWLYRTTFEYEATALSNSLIEFEGLDTFCDVYLNSQLILSADNQFRTWQAPVEPVVGQNVLFLYFKSAKHIAKDLEAQYGIVRAGSVNLGDPSRVYVRKAQYDWRWDWGPELMTCGPYRPITLISYTTRIKNVYARAYTQLVASPNASEPTQFVYPASLIVDISLQGLANSSKAPRARVTLKDAVQGGVIRQDVVSLTKRESMRPRSDGENDEDAFVFVEALTWSFDTSSSDMGVGKVELWWPVGYGKQNLYDVQVELLDGADATSTTIFDTNTQRVGFRSVKLVQESIEEPDIHGKGTTFLFEVNGVRMFLGAGSNWIPGDNFLTMLTPGRYRDWLTLARDGGQNVIRLWGGGVYEPDVFYDVCDELGLLVWQDFQFACGVYPAHNEFVSSVRAEAIDNIVRLRHHPCIALLCGNNEDYQQVLQWGDVPDLPARKIYEHLLPSLVSSLTSPEIPYHRGSPCGGEGWDTADPTVGDVHQWNIWAGEKPWHDYDRMGGRFVSEFGVPSFPCMRTIEYWLDSADVPKSQRYAQSKAMAQHCKAGSYERRFAVLMNELLRLTGDLETHVYNTQLLQSEAMGFAYREWRRAWRGPGKQYTAGAIVWQLNDSWPVMSWAIVDYFLRPKPAYYTISRELKPIVIGISRTVTKNRQCDRPRQFYEFGAFQSTGATLDIWGANSTLSSRTLSLEIRYFDLESDWTHSESMRNIALAPNQSTEFLTSVPCHGPPASSKTASQLPNPEATTTYSVVVTAILRDPDIGKFVARAVDWPQPYKFLDPPEPGLSLRVEDDGETVHATVVRPVKGLVLGVDDPERGDDGVKWSDNMLDVVPGDEQVVVASGLGGRGIRAAWLGKERAEVCEVRRV